MSNNNGGLSCALGCWALAAGVGLLTAILLMVLGDTGLIASVFLGGVLAVLLGLLLNWLFCSELPAIGSVKPGQDTSMRAVPPAKGAHGGASGHGAGAAAASAASSTASSAEKPASAASETAAPAAAASTPAADASAARASDPAPSPIKASAPLAGQDDLAARKGEWTYDGDSAAGDAGAADGDDAAGDGDANADRDGDGVAEGASEGVKPATLTAARDGKADDLKRIKGIGPKLEQLCNRLGFYHFDQIAAWTSDEVAWVDANLEGFRGRVTRDTWVEQAKLLASGGETDFSKKVDKGDVYD